MTNCPICIEPLSEKPFGNTAPCGHYFHEECYDRWVAKSSKQLVTGEWFTKCPTCNTHCSSFIRSYLDLDTLNVDNVSISSDESDGGNTPSTRTSSDDKLERKYKVMKRKLTAMKDSVAQQQETNLENLNNKAETTAETKRLRESNEALSGKLEKESYDNRHNRREVQELRKEVNEYQEETESLKERLIV